MPFIYKDIDLEVLEDYVDIEVQFVETSSLKPVHVIKNSKPLEKLNQNYKAIFIGSAGMGKSTFFRYATLSILNNKYPYFLAALKKQIPIFISLKAVPNFGKSPILRTLLEDTSFLRHDGIKKLSSLTAKSKVFFLLDGYDEISFTTSNNHIRYELGLLLSTTMDVDVDEDCIDTKYLQIYKNITRCNVWLSTREEFYRLNPIGIKASSMKESSTRPFSKDFIAVQLRGLGDNRLVLVKKIFDKYRSRSKRFAELLDEEVFIEEIDTHQDEEMVRLSKRPLFLTILCYIHVNHLLENDEKTFAVLPYLNELVLECIKVLLSDLDKFKVREYSAEQKKLAFVKRRSNYLYEKTEFLKYFAFELLLSGENIFNVNSLTKYVRVFFEKHLSNDNTLAIMAELDQPRSNNPTFVMQLILSGVFVVVNANPDNLLYDFPHRRFKEVLATEALKNPHMFDYFISKIKSRNLSEFVLIVFKYYKERQDDIMKSLFDGWDNDEDQLYSSQLIVNIINQNPTFKIDNYILRYLRDVIDANSYNKIYTELVLKSKDNFYAIKSLILDNIERYIIEGSLHSVNTILELGEFVNPNFLQTQLGQFREKYLSLEIQITLKKFELKSFIHQGTFIDIAHNQEHDEIFFIALSSITDVSLNDSFYISFFESLKLNQIISFWYLLFINNKNFSGKRKSSVFDIYQLVFTAFLNSQTATGFIDFTTKTLLTDLKSFRRILDSKDEKTDIEKLKLLEKEVEGLEIIIEKVKTISDSEWQDAKYLHFKYSKSRFEYLKDRLDFYKFYNVETID
ncbi:NACHT domain-containing protein [Mucilaginibacter aquatilis]|uniref:NACHT domain-containing protein n=1 Tax=Mucilaginibacter aquatilis TaxID=1517760 RepID=A0A6I4IRD1_9SPHI|nr:hypothetical protein [Mucilaginibacter aquatilis]MVN92664.1 hypothetical protein [Mucilaginibacter aquatilis]